jgi:nucleoside-diphosphate-sugar epimerase
MRVLIVGCGYVGLPLGTELVRQGHEAFGLRRSAPGELPNAGIIPLQADITNAASLSNLLGRFDWVVNCAASGGGGADDYRKLYLEGNRNLVSWLTAFPPKKFVYTSSTSVYAQNDGSVVTESSPTQPEAPTAKILAQAEETLLAAAKAGFPAVVLRVAGIYGPGRGHAFKQFLSGDARIEGSGARHLNMIHRDDLVRVIVAALERGRPGEIYNAADNESVTQLQFFEWLALKLSRPLPSRIEADDEGLRKRGLTNKRVSNAKLRKELEYEFTYPDFRAGYASEIARLKGPATP